MDAFGTVTIVRGAHSRRQMQTAGEKKYTLMLTAMTAIARLYLRGAGTLRSFGLAKLKPPQHELSKSSTNSDQSLIAATRSAASLRL